MAVPKKKISKSKRKIRLYIKKLAMNKYTKCKFCANFLKLHINCTSKKQCNLDKSNYTNIIEKNSLNIL